MQMEICELAVNFSVNLDVNLLIKCKSVNNVNMDSTKVIGT